jgi:tetratricopeptide (TPR) repeat protein
MFTKAIDLDPTNHVLYSNRSGALHGIHQMEEALADAERCIAIAPNWSKGHIRRAAALQGLQRFDDALREYMCAYNYNTANSEYVARKIEIDKEKLQFPDRSTVHAAAPVYRYVVPEPAAPLPPPELSGYLLKPRESGIGASKRWFILQGTTLKWYANKKVLNESRRCIDLAGAEIFSIKGAEFRISGPSLFKGMTLRADSIPEREQWVTALRLAIAMANILPPKEEVAKVEPLRSPLDQWVQPDPNVMMQ